MRSRLLLSGGAVTLDEALVGMIILMRWAAPHGWAVGKVTSQITTSTPRGHASSETITFAAHGPTVGPVGWTNNMLKLDQYDGGPAAEYGSLVILTKTSEI